MEEHAVILRGSRCLRRRWTTVVRRIERENKQREAWKRVEPPTFEKWLWHLKLEDTYSNRVGLPVRQDRSGKFIADIQALGNPKASYEALGKQLSKFTDKDVIVHETMSNSDANPEQRSIWFTTVNKLK